MLSGKWGLEPLNTFMASVVHDIQVFKQKINQLEEESKIVVTDRNECLVWVRTPEGEKKQILFPWNDYLKMRDESEKYWKNKGRSIHLVDTSGGSSPAGESLVWKESTEESAGGSEIGGDTDESISYNPNVDGGPVSSGDSDSDLYKDKRDKDKRDKDKRDKDKRDKDKRDKDKEDKKERRRRDRD